MKGKERARVTYSHHFPPNAMALYGPFQVKGPLKCCPICSRAAQTIFERSFACLGASPLPPLESSQCVSVAETLHTSRQSIAFTQA